MIQNPCKYQCKSISTPNLKSSQTFLPNKTQNEKPKLKKLIKFRFHNKVLSYHSNFPFNAKGEDAKKRRESVSTIPNHAQIKVITFHITSSLFNQKKALWCILCISCDSLMVEETLDTLREHFVKSFVGFSKI